MTCDEVLVACAECSVASRVVCDVQPGLALLDLSGDVGAYVFALCGLCVVPTIDDNFLSRLVNTADIAFQIVQLLLCVAVYEMIAACVVDAHNRGRLQQPPVEVGIGVVIKCKRHCSGVGCVRCNAHTQAAKHIAVAASYTVLAGLPVSACTCYIQCPRRSKCISTFVAEIRCKLYSAAAVTQSNRVLLYRIIRACVCLQPDRNILTVYSGIVAGVDFCNLIRSDAGSSLGADTCIGLSDHPVLSGVVYVRRDSVRSLCTVSSSVSLVAFRQHKIKSLVRRIACNSSLGSAAGRDCAYGKRVSRTCCTLCAVSSLSASLSGISLFALLSFRDAECKCEHFCCVLTGSCYSDSRILSGLQ